MNTAVHTRRWAWGLMVLGLVCVGLGTMAGSEGWQVWWRLDDALVHGVVMDIRLPRSVGAWLGGALLGLAGAVAQGLFRNPLADPYLLGSASGASLGVAIYLSLLGGSAWAVGLAHSLGMTGAAFVGAVAAVLLTLALARGVQQTLRLLLAGVVVGVVLGALTSLLGLLQPQVLQTMQGFMLGSTAFVSWASCLTMAGVLVLALALSTAFARVLDALTLGEATAQSLGVPLPWARFVLVAVLSLATAAAVAQMGLVAFVGLAAPHVVRSLVRTTHAGVLWLSVGVGGVLLVVADTFARVLLAPQELPVGVLTAVLGGGYLLWRLYRVSGAGGRA
ncbi:MAG: iron ABC transporter permease [Hydrogenophaga sp.]|jgi:iron complex transport system permease protein|nr:iron ABC transporter permease [Hydrogenophaga sp.]